MHSSIKYWYGTIGVLQPRDVEMGRPSTRSWGALSDRKVKDAIDKYLHPQSGRAVEEHSLDNEARFSPWESQRLLLKEQETGTGTQYGWSWPKNRSKIQARWRSVPDMASHKCLLSVGWQRNIHREIIGKSVNRTQNAFKCYCLSGDTVAFDMGYLFVLHTLLKMYCLHVRGSSCDWGVLHLIEYSTLIIVNPQSFWARDAMLLSCTCPYESDRVRHFHSFIAEVKI